MMQTLMTSSLNMSGFSETVGQANSTSYSPTTIAALIGSFLGTMGGVIVVVTSLSSPVKAMSKRIIIVISLADVLQAFPTLLVSALDIEEGNKAEHSLWWTSNKACKWQSFLITTGAMLTFLWTLGLSQHMFLLVRFGLKTAYKAYLCLYALSVVPFAVNIVAYRFDILGRDYITSDKNNTWCWITVNETTNNSANFLVRPCPATFWDGKAFEIICYIGVTVYCLLARFYLNRRSSTANSDDEDHSDAGVYTSGDTNVNANTYSGSDINLRVNKILAIPVALIVIRIWGTINRIACYCFSPNLKICHGTFFLAITSFCDPLQGFVNCILYKVSLNESCTCRCPAMIGDPVRRRIFKNYRRQTPNSYEPVTVWVSPGNSSFGDDY